MTTISDATGRWELNDSDPARIVYRDTDPFNAGRWHSVEPADRTTEPYRDDDTMTLIDEVIDSLIVMRGSCTANAASQLSVIASLIAELQSRVPETIFAARDQDYAWHDIAGRLHTAESTIRRRYRDYIARRQEMPLDNLD